MPVPRNGHDLVASAHSGVIDLGRAGVAGETELAEPGTHVFREEQLIRSLARFRCHSSWQSSASFRAQGWLRSQT